MVDLELFSRFIALLTGLPGAANRVGFYRFHNEGLYRGELLTRRVAYNPQVYIAKNFMALINGLCAPLEEIPHSKTRISDDEVAVLQMPVSEAVRVDMKSRLATVFSGYNSTRHRLVLLDPHASEQLRNIPGRMVTRAPHTSLSTPGCRPYTWPHGHSGPAHFAFDTRMPTIVLFGPETPALYGSLGNSEAIFPGGGLFSLRLGG